MYSLLILAATTLAKDDASNGLADKIASFFDYIISQVPSWIAGLVLFVLAFVVAKIAKTAVESRISDKIDEEHQEVLVLAGRVSYFGTLVVGITIALKVAGIDLTTILAAVAFGIGFALQDLIMNFLSGVLLLLNRQFTIGDFIRVGSTYGKVVEIQTRATIIKAIDGTKVIVPNATIFRSQVISYTTNPTRRVVVPFSVSYDTEIKYAMKVVMKLMKAQAKILKKPMPTIIITGFGDSSIDFEVRFWVGSRDGWFKIKTVMMHKVYDALVDAGIDIPFNVVHLETAIDTKADKEENAKIREARKIEMKMSKAIAAEATPPTQIHSIADEAPTAADLSTTVATETQVTDTATTAVQEPQIQIEVPAISDMVPSDSDPTGAYEDMTEIDGQG